MAKGKSEQTSQVVSNNSAARTTPLQPIIAPIAGQVGNAAQNIYNNAQAVQPDLSMPHVNPASAQGLNSIISNAGATQSALPDMRSLAAANLSGAFINPEENPAYRTVADSLRTRSQDQFDALMGQVRDRHNSYDMASGGAADNTSRNWAEADAARRSTSDFTAALAPYGFQNAQTERGYQVAAPALYGQIGDIGAKAGSQVYNAGEGLTDVATRDKSTDIANALAPEKLDMSRLQYLIDPMKALAGTAGAWDYNQTGSGTNTTYQQQPPEWLQALAGVAGGASMAAPYFFSPTTGKFQLPF